MSTEILVIGPEHPCIRCVTLFKRAKEVAGMFDGKVQARKIFSNTEEARKYGKIEGGLEISVKENVDHDHDGIERIMKEIDALNPEDAGTQTLIEAKMQDIQEKLTPLTKKADEVGYLMTPVLVINQQVIASGYVPDKDKMVAWVKSQIG